MTYRKRLTGVMKALILMVVSIVAITSMYDVSWAKRKIRFSGSDIRNNSISGRDIENNSLTGLDIKNGSIRSLEIKDGTILGKDIADGTISASKLSSNNCSVDQVLKYNGSVWACANVEAGPQGVPGAEGPQGPQGEQGPPGEAGLSLDGDGNLDLETGDLTAENITSTGSVTIGTTNPIKFGADGTTGSLYTAVQFARSPLGGWTYLNASYDPVTQFLTENNQSGFHFAYVGANPSTGPSSRGIIIVEAKAGTRNWLLLNLGGYGYFDLTNGVVGTLTNATAYGIKPMGGGWYEVSLAPTITPANNWAGIASANNSNNYQGDGTSGLYIRGNPRVIAFRDGKLAATRLSTTDSIHASLLIPKYRGIVGIGDSLFTPGNIGGVTYCHVRANSTSENIVVHLMGLGGTTLTQIMSTFISNITPYNPSAVILEGGINDINYATEDPNTAMQEQVESFVSKCSAVSTLPVLCTLPPDKNYVFWSAARQTWMDTYNTWITAYAATNGIPLLDLKTILSDDGQTLKTSFDSGDGLHPNTAGQSAIGDAIVTLLDNQMVPATGMQ